MGFGKSMAVVLLAACLLTFAGCGGSPADQAAEEMLDLAAEMKSLANDRANLAKMKELAPKAIEIQQRLLAEIAKMTPEENKAFEAKWIEKLEEALGDDEPWQR